MFRSFRLALGVALALSFLMLLASPASASILVSDPGQPVTYTLQQVIDAGGLRVGDKVFTDWRVTASSSVNGVAPGAGAITVTGVLVGGELGLRFNGAWTAGPQDLIDTTIGFKVTADAPFLIHDNSLYITAFGAANGGIASISEQVYDADPNQGFLTPLANKFVWVASDINFNNFDHKEFTKNGENVALPSVWVVKDIALSGGVQQRGLAGISEFYQTFSQVPEPATLSMLVLGGLALIRRRRA